MVKKVKFWVSALLLSMMIAVSAQGQMQNNRDVPYGWKTDTTQRIIPLSELQVVLPRNSFPTIDFPTFTGRKEGLQNFYEKEPVIAVAIKGNAKAYPLNMLTTHEISNDTLSGVPILATYCPLCNASVVYNRQIKQNGTTHLLHFEVSGMLRKSDMVMADKKTESWWQQLSGKALVGDYAGSVLEMIPSQVITVQEFFDRYPQGQILSTDTKQQERYGKNPYSSYDKESGRPMNSFFNHDSIDNRLPPMQRVVDVQIAEKYKAYPLPTVAAKKVLHDQFQGKDIVLFYRPSAISVLDKSVIRNSRTVGTVTALNPVVEGNLLHFTPHNENFKDEQTGSIWDVTGYCTQGKYKGTQLRTHLYGVHFAFAWLAFHPDTKIYSP